ncbi:MAG TPA: tetratricopeptide repeat protein [Geminicoccus sp.]|uniref:tetratricopeptide repeat protein n=1 Tax=Geminicoccus sp. TaxID=2024832 RepID=UPI002E309ACF|nr:tetratricopeptide repeat protein [Geminicoccus sp.]HEX2524958.1 tetratricopeptide repeat protein [Geminicoccus sp.]
MPSLTLARICREISLGIVIVFVTIGGPAKADEHAAGTCRTAVRDPALRIEACTKAIREVSQEDTVSKAEFLRYRAIARRASGAVDDALIDLDEAIKVQPDHAGAWLIRAAIRQDLGNIDGALSDVEQAQALSPRSPQVWRRRGVLLDEKGEFDRAYAALNRALELNPRYAEAYFDRGDLLRREGYLVEAIDDLTTAIELAPRMAIAWNARGSTWANLDDNQRALADFNQAIDLRPEFADAYVNRGSIRWRLADTERALSDYGRAIELDPANVDAWLNRGRAFEAMGRVDEARHDMEMATALGARQRAAREDAQRTASADNGPAQQGAFYITTRAVNYRLGPSTHANRLGSLASGERVQVVGERQGWLEISVPTGGRGYVWHEFLELEK